jgi:hypothetical protein
MQGVADKRTKKFKKDIDGLFGSERFRGPDESISVQDGARYVLLTPSEALMPETRFAR